MCVKGMAMVVVGRRKERSLSLKRGGECCEDNTTRDLCYIEKVLDIQLFSSSLTRSISNSLPESLHVQRLFPGFQFGVGGDAEMRTFPRHQTPIPISIHLSHLHQLALTIDLLADALLMNRFHRIQLDSPTGSQHPPSRRETHSP